MAVGRSTQAAAVADWTISHGAHESAGDDVAVAPNRTKKSPWVNGILMSWFAREIP